MRLETPAEVRRAEMHPRWCMCARCALSYSMEWSGIGGIDWGAGESLASVVTGRVRGSVVILDDPLVHAPIDMDAMRASVERWHELLSRRLKG